MIGYVFPTTGARVLALAPSLHPCEYVVLSVYDNRELVVATLPLHTMPEPQEWHQGHYFDLDQLTEALEYFISRTVIDTDLFGSIEYMVRRQLQQVPA